jgi:predicted dehydrogenase
VAAIEAGRHVLVEKPLALDIASCRYIGTAAAANDRVVAVDHLLRFSPLVLALRRLLAVESAGRPVLGPVRRLSFENDAACEGLGTDHWFWDPSRSGGIFVEHGVHLFDLAVLLIGAAPASVQAMATGTGRVESVCATAVFPRQDGVPATATWYHSFTHGHDAEHQWLRLDLGRAECRLAGWIPLSLWLDLSLDDDAAGLVEGEAGAAAVEHGLALEPTSTGLRLRESESKDTVYAGCVRAVLADLLAAIDQGRSPTVGVAEATAAVAVALAATEAAALGRTVPVHHLHQRQEVS